MQLHDCNRRLSACGYSAIGEQEQQAIALGAGAVWVAWLNDCSQFQRDSPHWDALRSAVMAVSVVASQALRSLSLSATLVERVRTFLRIGKPLRAALAAYVSDTSSSDPKSQAAAFIGASFAATPKDQSTSFQCKVHHVYGTKAAVVFEYAKTRDGRSCLQVEAAGREDRSKGFDWNSKIVLQLSDTESLQVLAVLRNWKPSLDVANHGAQRDKRMTLSKQAKGGGYLVSVRQGTTARVVPMPTFEVFRVISLVMRVLGDNSPHLDPGMIAEMCQEIASQPG